MSAVKPNCKDFIVAAIRKIRPSPSNISIDKKSGVGLRRLWVISSRVYSEAEFRSAFNLLLKDGTLLAVWRICHKDKKGSGTYRTALVEEIPAHMPLDMIWWHCDKVGKTIPREKCGKVAHDVISQFRVYIPADGLPKVASSLVTERSNGRVAGTVAAILKEMSGG